MRFRRGNYFGGERIGRAEVELRVGKLKNGKATGGVEITGEMIKGGGNRVVDWICKLCNINFERGIVSEDLRSAVIAPLCKGKGEIIECKNYRGISLLSMVGRIYAGMLIHRVCRVTVGLIDDEQGSFRLYCLLSSVVKFCCRWVLVAF